MEVLGISATKNRHQHIEKLVSCFLQQDYEGKHSLLIYNNAEQEQRLDRGDGFTWHEGNKSIYLHNCPASRKGTCYTNLGEIYNDILYLIGAFDPNTLVNHMDDDDIFLPNHFKEGVSGYTKGSLSGKKAYKPAKSWFKTENHCRLDSNVLEPSIFVNLMHLLEYGYRETNADSHHQWLTPLIVNNQIFIDPTGMPTFVYDWSGEIPVWKTSGDPNNPKNFENYTNYSKDYGDQIITPISLEQLKKHYDVFDGSKTR